MKTSTKAPTKEQIHRWNDLQAIGCVVTLLRTGVTGTPGDVHHLLSGGKRMGHDFTIVLHPWYHRGVSDLPPARSRELFGPSLALHKKEFIEEFGGEMYLLEVSNQLLTKYRNTINSSGSHSEQFRSDQFEDTENHVKRQDC